MSDLGLRLLIDGRRAQRARSHRRKPKGWEKYERLLTEVEQLHRPSPTRGLLERADLLRDQRGGIGALHAASALDKCHAVSGGRRTLIWLPGPRPEGDPVPKLAREEEYRRIVRLLSERPRAAFPTGYLQELAGGRTRQEVVGAMKLLVIAGVAVHVALVPYEGKGAISCWAFADPALTLEHRVYSPGQRPKASLSLDAEHGARLADAVSFQRDMDSEDI